MQIAEDLIQNKIHVNDFYNAGLQQFNHEQSQLKECTFVPQIKGLRKDMQTAQLYTSINAFERLSKPLSQLMPQIEGSMQYDEQAQQNQEPIQNQVIPEEESEIDRLQDQIQSFGNQLQQQFRNFNDQQLSGQPLSQACSNLSAIMSQSNI